MRTQIGSFGPFLVLALIGSLSPPLLANPPKIRVTTGVLERDYAWTPLQFELRGAVNLPAVRVRSTDSGKVVPSQLEWIAGGSRVWWLVSGLEKGKRYGWELELLTRATPDVPRLGYRDVDDSTVAVLDGDIELTRYVFAKDQFKPYFYPIHGPADAGITRHYPMKEGVEGEKSDHPHHRSLWFTHGEVNDLNFWHESDDPNTGRIRHRGFEAREVGDVYVRLVSTNGWNGPDGKPVLEERRDVRIYGLEKGEMLMDFSIDLVAVVDEVVFGDTKEGSFGIRVAGTMKETSGGQMVNSRGGRGANECWGKPAEWVDYYGPVDGKTVGVAILDHPTSFRHPTHWHVRDYGLFAANPFGYKHFYQRDSSEEGRRLAASGKHRLEKGQSIRLRYRLYFHHGDAEKARVAQIWDGFARPPALEFVR